MMADLSKSQVADLLLRMTEGKRGADGKIGVAIGAFSRRRNKKYDGRLDYVDVRKSGVEMWPGHGGDQLVPRYTESLDAAMSLAVPTHHILAIHEMPASWIVRIGSRSNDREPIIEADGKHLPAVLSAAWLLVGET